MESVINTLHSRTYAVNSTSNEHYESINKQKHILYVHRLLVLYFETLHYLISGFRLTQHFSEGSMEQSSSHIPLKIEKTSKIFFKNRSVLVSFNKMKIFLNFLKLLQHHNQEGDEKHIIKKDIIIQVWPRRLCCLITFRKIISCWKFFRTSFGDSVYAEICCEQFFSEVLGEKFESIHASQLNFLLALEKTSISLMKFSQISFRWSKLQFQKIGG